MKKIAFIGAGNMGGAIITGLVRAKACSACDIYVCDKALRADIAALGVIDSSLKDAVDLSDVVVLAVKPNVIFDVIADIKSECNIDGKVFVSIAAGIKLSDLSDALGTCKLVRVMPNLCLLAGEGMSVICAHDSVSRAELCDVQKIFASSGKTIITKETLIDSCTAINGSGPAYVFMFIEALADAAVKHGIDRATAYELSTQTVLGSAAMVQSSGLHPAVLKDMVCSPGGTTIEAVKALEATGLRASVMAAVDACAEKASKLGGK
ncbi:MAG: pyrroline-5-carboxylate reductase [Clostridia bacterium]|nr:pyrroline-5-carboxylate reductase [Clostridia bacterium]